MINFDKLANAMGELDEDIVQEEIKAVTTTEEANQAMEACQVGMNTVGRLFEEGEYFVGDLIFAGELMTDAVEVLKPLLASSESTGTKAKMILCTVKDDLHDIGKNIPFHVGSRRLRCSGSRHRCCSRKDHRDSQSRKYPHCRPLRRSDSGSGFHAQDHCSL